MSKLAIHGGTPIRHHPLPNVLSSSGRTIGAEEQDAVSRVLASGVLNGVLGSEVARFESASAELFSVAEGVACSSGTAAIHCALAGIGVAAGDEVITTPISDFGTVLPILALGATPVFVDVDPLTGNLDPAQVAAHVGARTKAILAVHLFGASSAVRTLDTLATSAGVALIEDAAQAWLGKDGDRLLGTFGQAGCFSLQQYKHITSGDGGLIVTDDPGYAHRMRVFADKGRDRSVGRRHDVFGFNYRMTELQAAVACAQLVKVKGVVAARRRMAAHLISQLGGLDGIHFPDPSSGHAWWMMPLVLTRQGPTNQMWAEALSAEGVPAVAGYLERPLYREKCLASTSDAFSPARIAELADRCQSAEHLIDETLVVVPWNEMYSVEDVEDIGAAILKVHQEFS